MRLVGIIQLVVAHDCVQALHVIHATFGILVQCFRQVPAVGLFVLLAKHGAFLTHAFIGAVGVQVEHVGFNRVLWRVECGDAVVTEFRALLFGLDAFATEVPLAK